MRLRILDLNFWPLWLVAFYRRESSGHVAIHIYGYQKWDGPWLNVWKWEKEPEQFPMMPSDELQNPSPAKLEKAQ